MPDIDVLRELTGQLRAPGFDDLVAVSRRRRRRAAAGAAAAVAVVALAVGGAVLALPHGADTPEPAPQPSPSATPAGEAPTVERIRDTGYLQGEVTSPQSNLSAATYALCDRASCDGPLAAAHLHLAVEVSQGPRSALFDVAGPDVRVLVLDEDTVVVQDDVVEDGPGRQRLLRADGTEVELRPVAQPAPAVPGPGVFVDDYAGDSVGMAGMESLAVVDAEARTVQPVDAPAAVRYWGPNTDEALWGVTDDCRVMWATDGTFRQREVGCSPDLQFTYLVAQWFPEGWLRPGRMVLAEQTSSGSRIVLHVTLDGGETWQEVPLRDDSLVTEALRDLG
jgi:hypothetical protein